MDATPAPRAGDVGTRGRRDREVFDIKLEVGATRFLDLFDCEVNTLLALLAVISLRRAEEQPRTSLDRAAPTEVTSVRGESLLDKISAVDVSVGTGCTRASATRRRRGACGRGRCCAGTRSCRR